MNEIPKMPAMKEGFKQRLETPAGKLIEPRNLKEAPVMERGYTVPGKTAFEEEI